MISCSVDANLSFVRQAPTQIAYMETRDVIAIVGSVVGLVGGVLAIIEHLINLRRHAAVTPGPDQRGREPATPLHPNATLREYLIPPELLFIIPAGLLINYFGLAVSVHLKSLLYLDMTGTAVAAFLVGPWWGAVVGLLSNSFVNWLLYPDARPDMAIFPWSPVNIGGALLWGYLARTVAFRRYVGSVNTTLHSHIGYLLIFGVFGALGMSAAGAMIQTALRDATSLSLDASVSVAIDRLLIAWQPSLAAMLAPVFGDSSGNGVAYFCLTWLQHWVRYIPDKMMTAAFAIVLLHYAFPLYKRELLCSREQRRFIDTWLAPLTLIILYLPSFMILMRGESFNGRQFWLLWSAPLIAGLGCFIYRAVFGPSSAMVLAQNVHRAGVYAGAIAVGQRSEHGFYRLLPVAMLVAGGGVVLGLPVLTLDFYQVVLKVFAVLYGFLLGAQLMRLTIAQHLFLAEPDEEKVDLKVAV